MLESSIDSKKIIDTSKSSIISTKTHTLLDAGRQN